MSEEKTIKTTCRMCHGGCGVIVHLKDGRISKITPDPKSLVNKGRICPKGMASAELLNHPDRILYPLRRGGKRGENKWERISWDEALDEMARKLSQIKTESGAEYFAMVQGTGRPYTDLTSRFVNAFGTPNFTGIAHVCYVPRVMASAFTSGLAQLPMPDMYGFGGITPSCVVMWGSNVTETGAAHGIYAHDLKGSIEKAQKVIAIDPRRTKTAQTADIHLQIRPGTDGALALAMLHVIITENLYDQGFVKQHTEGFGALTEHVRPFSPKWAHNITGVGAELITKAARAYATAKPAAIQWGNGIDMSLCSFQTARSIMILRAITGNYDAPGGDIICVPPEKIRLKSLFVNSEISGKLLLPLEKFGFAVDTTKYDQHRNSLNKPWVRAGYSIVNRTIKSLYRIIVRRAANKPMPSQFEMIHKLKAGRFPLLPIVHPPSFWESIVAGNPYPIRALWIMGSNPLLNMTNSLQVEKALGMLEYTVVSDFFMTPTAQHADLFLPAAMWLEQDDIVNSFKQWHLPTRKKIVQTGEVRDDRDVMIDLAHRLGFGDAFPWDNWRGFLDGMLKDAGMDFDSFFQQGPMTGKMAYFKYKSKGFNTPSGKFEIYSSTLAKMGISPLPVYREPSESPLSTPALMKAYPLILTTGAKTLPYFHSEGRQLKSLRKMNPFPQLEIFPDTAQRLGIQDGDHVTIETMNGRVKMQAKYSDGVAENVVSAPHAWWFPEEAPPEYGWKKSSINLLFGKMVYDPDIGSEPLRSALCRVYKSNE